MDYCNYATMYDQEAILVPSFTFFFLSVNTYLKCKCICKYILLVWFRNRLSMADPWLALHQEPEGRKVRDQRSEPWKPALLILCSAPSLTQGTWHVWKRWRRTALAHLLIQHPAGGAPQGQTLAPTMSSMSGRSQTAAAQNMRTETGNKTFAL